jgi:O-antigen ligase
LGYDSNAFGLGLREYYGRGSGHSHSALLDVALGTGIPELILVVGFFGSVLRGGWASERRLRNGLGLLLAMVAAALFVRAAVDSSLRDHMLQQILFVFGLLLGLVNGSRQEKRLAS